MSGTFVEMLRRIVDLSGYTSNPGAGVAGEANAETVAPLRTLDGFGAFGPPPSTAKPLPADFRDRATIDHPPGFYGPADGPLAVNALAAADRVLIPVQAEYYALEGLSQLVQSINLVKARLNPRLAVGGVLLTMVDGRTRLSADVEAEVRKHFGELVFTQTVPRSVRLAEAPSHGLPAIAYDRRSRGADAYWKVAMELVDRA